MNLQYESYCKCSIEKDTRQFDFWKVSKNLSGDL